MKKLFLSFLLPLSAFGAASVPYGQLSPTSFDTNAFPLVVVRGFASTSAVQTIYVTNINVQNLTINTNITYTNGFLFFNTITNSYQNVTVWFTNVTQRITNSYTINVGVTNEYYNSLIVLSNTTIRINGTNIATVNPTDLRIPARGSSNWFFDSPIRLLSPSLQDIVIDDALLFNSSDTGIFAGSGSPEGVQAANIGSLFLRTNGVSGTTIYTKTSGSGNTGWEPLSVSGGGGSDSWTNIAGVFQPVDLTLQPMVALGLAVGTNTVALWGSNFTEAIASVRDVDAGEEMHNGYYFGSQTAGGITAGSMDMTTNRVVREISTLFNGTTEQFFISEEVNLDPNFLALRYRSYWKDAVNNTHSIWLMDPVGKLVNGGIGEALYQFGSFTNTTTNIFAALNNNTNVFTVGPHGDLSLGRGSGGTVVINSTIGSSIQFQSNSVATVEFSQNLNYSLVNTYYLNNATAASYGVDSFGRGYISDTAQNLQIYSSPEIYGDMTVNEGGGASQHLFVYGDTLADVTSIGQGRVLMQLSSRNLGSGLPSQYGFLASNAQAASAGQPQNSAGVSWRGNGWSTNDAASEVVTMVSHVLVEQGAARPSGILLFTPIIHTNTMSSVFGITTGGSPVISQSHTPASSAETNYIGAIAWDSSYVYVWTATNVNKRVALSTW